MPQIQVLDQITIDKIAAGEVIERPASIVKELVENSIDAKAASVTVEIQDGGISLIRVTDNGSGIEREDIRNAFLRHSTSKIRKVEDLAHIASLGFRGEALSSISAVTRTELITKTKEDTFGTRYVIEGGADKSYGIQVAKLAGVPDVVITRAKEIVEELSDEDITTRVSEIASREKEQKKKQKTKKYDEVDMAQMSLFDTVKDDDVLEELKSIDVGNLTPVDALNTIYRLQNKLKNRW